jgi:hypothetical protein
VSELRGAGVPVRDHIEVWQQRPGLWRWMFVAGGDHTEILSNETYRSLDQALGAATVAYPGVPVPGYERRASRVWPWVVVGIAGALAVGGLVWAARRSRGRRHARRLS